MQVLFHTDLAWILATLCPQSRLARMTQYKAANAPSSLKAATAGLLYYPILQASDILLYRATLVPVGHDQLQHVELTRFLARRLNTQYGLDVPIPTATSTSLRIMSLVDPRRKMSKSVWRR